MTYKEELKKIFWDKGLSLIGLLFISFFVTYQIDKFKSEDAFKTEIAKQRVTKNAEVWAAWSKYEFATDKYFTGRETITLESRLKQLKAINNNQKSMYSESHVEELNKKRESAEKALIELMHDNRFYLGEEIYGKFWLLISLQQQIIRDQNESIKTRNSENIQFTDTEVILNKVQSLRKDIKQLSEEILEEIY